MLFDEISVGLMFSPFIELRLLQADNILFAHTHAQHLWVLDT